MDGVTVDQINIQVNGDMQTSNINALNRSNQKFHEFLPAQSDRKQGQREKVTKKGKIKQFFERNTLKIGICTGIIISLAIVIGLSLGILLRGKGGNGEPDLPNQPDQPTITAICQKYQSECVGVPTQVQQYIQSNYRNVNQIRSLLQVSRTMSIIQQNMTNNTKEEFIGSYRQIFRSVQCLNYILGGNSNNAYQNILKLQLNTAEDLAAYFSMTQQFSGQPVSLTSIQNIASTCQFQLSSNSNSQLRSSPYSVGVGADTICNAGNSSLIYFDGIGYGPNHAANNLLKIRQVLQGSQNISFDSMISVGAWRTDDAVGFLIGIITAYRQKISQSSGNPPSEIDLYNCLARIIETTSLKVPLPATITSQVFKKFLQFFKEYISNQMTKSIENYNVEMHKRFVTQQISEGRKVVLVAHAEGSLYANSVYKLFSSQQKKYVSLVYLAPTASQMADGTSNYITNPNDKVISALQQFANLTGQFALPLRANVEAKIFEANGLNHEVFGYVQSYKTIFLDLVGSAKQRALQPPPSLGSGPITVVLQWNSRSDLDLHIFEPQNSHVYYDNKNGIVGSLDRDDTNGYGPQHYYTDCSKMIEGSYVIKIHNFWENYNRTMATVTVSAGSEFLMKSYIVPGPHKDAEGNHIPPLYFCTIVVSLNNLTNSYEYKITQ